MSKKDITPKDTRYVPLVQQKYCCVPACIQMVMLKHGIPLQSAELMARHMDIVVAPEYKSWFWNIKTSKIVPRSGYGTQLNENLTANPMFKKLKIPLRMEFNLIDNFNSAKELGEHLNRMVKDDQDVIVCYQYGVLFGSDYTGGHVNVVDRVYPKTREVRLIDPEYNVPKWRTVKIAKLYKAMKTHGADKMGGLWEFKKV